MIYVPHTELSPATERALAAYEVIYVRLDGDDGYPRFLGERWAAGETFVNVEHDVAPWPGAVDGLLDCPEPWCGYDYGDACPTGPTALLGCVKLTAELMRATPTIWDDMLTQPNVWSDLGIPGWGYCDLWLDQQARPVVEHHLHTPAVVNGRV